VTIWPNDIIQINGKPTKAIAPLIISASRATDIPAFYARNFIDQLKKGFLVWTNPFNGKKIPVSLRKVQLIVFWTKNPNPLLPYLSQIDEMGIDYYFNYTLNDYENERLEKNLPSLKNRINSFIELSERTGKEKIIWRFDPVVLLKGHNQQYLIEKIVSIGKELHFYTEKLVFSFLDFHYKKVQSSFKNSGIDIVLFSENEKILFSKELSKQMKPFNLLISTCAEHLDFEKYGVGHNKCIDDELITRLFPGNKVLTELIEFLQINNAIKDKGQRKYCCCIPSKDIGKYDTCLFHCLYCYAVRNKYSPLKIEDI
jgi:hypothetical protein